MNHWLFCECVTPAISLSASRHTLHAPSMSSDHVDDPTAGYYEYDHIVSIAKIESDYDDDEYHDDDVITISDHALWAPRGSPPPYYWTYTVATVC